MADESGGGVHPSALPRWMWRVPLGVMLLGPATCAGSLVLVPWEYTEVGMGSLVVGWSALVAFPVLGAVLGLVLLVVGRKRVALAQGPDDP